LKPAKKVKAKSIFVKWGHFSGGEEKFADFSIAKAKDLEDIIN
jgi:phosphoglycolate phosphatase-like HAD superfamily hydrolase